MDLRSTKRQPGIEVPQLLTAKDLEALLKIDVKTIYGYVQRGLIPYVRIQSNVRFKKSDIGEWIAGQSFEPSTRPRTCGPVEREAA